MIKSKDGLGCLGMLLSQGQMCLDTACPWSKSVLDVAIQVNSTISCLHTAFRRGGHTYTDP